MPPVRLFGNAVLSFLTKLSSGYLQLFDPTNGFTAIHRLLLSELDFARIAKGYSSSRTCSIISTSCAPSWCRCRCVPVMRMKPRACSQRK